MKGPIIWREVYRGISLEVNHNRSLEGSRRGLFKRKMMLKIMKNNTDAFEGACINHVYKWREKGVAVMSTLLNNGY